MRKRHHNKNGRRQIQRGKTAKEVERIAKRLGVKKERPGYGSLK